MPPTPAMPVRIHLVEDHPVMREAYTQLIAIEPEIELCGASESAEAFFASGAADSCDLVVTDLSLPGMDGIELVRHLSADHPTVPAVVISAHDEPVYRDRSLAAGARAYLTKRDLARKLGPTVHRVMAERTPGDDAAAS